MYSEADDFIEKRQVYSRMAKALDDMIGAAAIEKFHLALELGGSGGLLAGMASNTGPRVICTDIVDVQLKYNGEFPRLLKEKFERNGLDLDLGKIEFHTQDAQSLIYGDNQFDLVFSLNAFEHIPDPLRAIEEVHRVLKPGGLFYATFDPVWTADSGSHFIHYTRNPWLHLLINDDEYCAVMKKAGAADWELREYRTAMNRLPASFYKTKLKDKLAVLFSKHVMIDWSGCTVDAFNTHPNLAKAAKLNRLQPEDLLIRGFQIVAVR